MSSPLKPLSSVSTDGQPVTVARFLDDQRVVTGTGDLKTERWHADPDLLNETDVRLRFTRFDLAACEPRLVELGSIAQENVGKESPLGAVVAAVSPGDGLIFVGFGGPQPKHNVVETFDQPAADGQSNTTSYLGHTDADSRSGVQC